MSVPPQSPVPAPRVGQWFDQAPPEPPRTLSARARRRAWMEPRVRIWWTCSLLLMLLAVYFVVRQVIASREDRWLMQHGIEVRATITHANGSDRPTILLEPSENAEFTMTVPLPSGTHTIVGRLKAQTRALGPGQSIPLHIDPDNPHRWTDRRSASLLEDLLLGIILLPLVAAMLTAGIVQRLRILRVWRTGQAMPAVVVETRQSAAAPLSRSIRFTLRDARSRQVFSATVPVSAGVLRPGDQFWIVAPSHQPRFALVAALYRS